MKVALLIVVVGIIGAFAEETSIPEFKCTSSNSFVCTFQKLGHQIKHHATTLGGKLKDVGTSVLNAALDQGSGLLANAGQAVLGTVMEHLTKEGLVGKREIAFFDKIRAHVSNGMDMLKKAKVALHTAFEKAVNKLTGVMSNVAGLKKIEDDADKQIDDAVDEFNKEGKKGFLSMAATIAKKIQTIFAEGMAKLKDMFVKKAAEKRAIFGFDSLSAAWEKAKQSLSGVAGSLADTFKPHLDTLKAGISTLADKAKEHGSNLVDTANKSFQQLTDKLSTHIDTLKGHVGKLGDHATNAVNALKEAVANIAAQAVGNAKDTLGDIVKTGTDAAGTVKDHVNDAVSGY